MKRTMEDEINMMSYLGRLYRKYAQKASSVVEEVQEGTCQYYSEEFMVDIHRILRELPDVYVEIIQNDFLSVSDALWWQNKYDEMTYRRLKNMAVKAFFHCLYV